MGASTTGTRIWCDRVHYDVGPDIAEVEERLIAGFRSQHSPYVAFATLASGSISINARKVSAIEPVAQAQARLAGATQDAAIV
jgi:hypothetical protein